MLSLYKGQKRYSLVCLAISRLRGFFTLKVNSQVVLRVALVLHGDHLGIPPVGIRPIPDLVRRWVGTRLLNHAVPVRHHRIVVLHVSDQVPRDVAPLLRPNHNVPDDGRVGRALVGVRDRAGVARVGRDHGGVVPR
uniref:(northern house mosquito) hypothetical protein n=1 Tax=Culex pipiens TaxID=7175 RepID=A0A8D8MSX5_CULPI